MAWRWPRREKSSVLVPACLARLTAGPAPHATSSHRPAQASGLTSQLCSLTSQSLHDPEFSGFWPHELVSGCWLLSTKSEGLSAFFACVPLRGK